MKHQKHKQRESRPCSYCGVDVFMRQGRRPSAEHWYCSGQCSYRFHNRLRTIRRGGKPAGTRRPRDCMRWSASEIAFLRDNYKRMEHWELAEHLGRGAHAVGQKKQQLGLYRRLWTKADEQFLREHYHRGLHWCAERLGRSRFSVCVRGRAMGLQINKWWSKAEIDRMLELHSLGWATAQIADEMQAALQVVRHHLIVRGLKPNPPNYRHAKAKWRATHQKNKRMAFVLQIASLGKALEAACPK